MFASSFLGVRMSRVTGTDVVIGNDSGHHSDDAALVEEDLLVEDVSIDGMCGVY